MFSEAEEHPEHSEATEYYKEKAISVRRGRYYRRVYGREALARLEVAYAVDVNYLCDMIETLQAKFKVEAGAGAEPRRGEVRLEE